MQVVINKLYFFC